MKALANISITVNHVTKLYQKNQGIIDISMTFTPKVLHLIVGENGSGKSTLLKCMMGLVHFQGKIQRRRVKIGYAPEQYVMPGALTVEEFLISIGRIKGSSRTEVYDQVHAYLNFFGLENDRKTLIKKLSNGMKQKVNLMQAFVHEPKVILLDEPLAALDEEMVPKVINLIKEKAKNALVIVSTHHPTKFRTKKKIIWRFVQGRLIHDSLD